MLVSPRNKAKDLSEIENTINKYTLTKNEIIGYNEEEIIFKIIIISINNIRNSSQSVYQKY